jgi:hypothetical protein
MEGMTEQLDVLENVITYDDAWIFQYDPETKRHSLHWKTPRMKKARMSKLKVKAVMIVFFNIRGTVMI